MIRCALLLLACLSAQAELRVVEDPELWLRIVGKTSSPTDASRAWASLIRTRSANWARELGSLMHPFPEVASPDGTIVIGHGGGEDAFAPDATTIAFDAVRLHKEYGDASLPENKERIDRFFRHEYTHLLQKAWLAEHPYVADTPLRKALLDIWTEGLGNYYSLSPRWRSPELVSKTLAELEPRFVARLTALACASPSDVKMLTADLSMGRFDQKWGALPAALWLDAEAQQSPHLLRAFVLAGPDGVWNLAERHLSESSRAVIRETRAAAELCVPTPSALWGQLVPGPHAVGFRARHVADQSRTWRTTRSYDGTFSPDTTGRPIQISIWYPAQRAVTAKAMPWQGYVEQHWPPAFEELNLTLRRRSREIAEGAVPPESVAALLAAPTGAGAQALPAPGRFPVVLYFGGMNADLHANAVLAEFLASHGYVVASISLLGPTDRQTSQGRTPADIEAIVRDMEYAWSLLGDDASIDRTRVATMGHSVGAIEAVLFGMRNGNVSAVVGLDGTYGFSGSVAALTSAYGYAPDAMRAAVLDLRRAPGEQSAELDLAAVHSLRYADRTLVTLRRMHHSDFTSFAMIAQVFHTPISSRAPAGEWNRETGSKGHQDTCEIVLAFLEEHMKKTPTQLATVITGIDGAAMTHSRASAVPPSAFELVRLVAQKGIAATQTLVTEICGNDVAACLEEGPLNSLGYELLGQDRPENALAAFRIAAWSHPSSANAQDSLADGCLAIHDRECGRQALERAIALAPGDPSLDAASKAQFIASAAARIRALN